MSFYTRTNQRVCFLWPSLAIGEDVDGRPFMEVGFLFWAVGLGTLE